MVEGTGLSLYMLIGAIMFGLFAGATAIFGEEVGAFVGGLVETVKDSEHNEANKDGGIVEEEDDPNCVLATDEDFSGTSNGEFIYIGSADCVRIPHVIKGVEVTSYQAMFYTLTDGRVGLERTSDQNMFSETSVSKVISDNPNVTDMSDMFYESKATELDLSSLDTSNVTNMWRMFGNSEATSLDLSSFDTSKVTNMAYMFEGSQATELDLSSFDTSNVKSMSMMFYNSQATELDLSSFNTSNVTDMVYMFYNSQATEIKGLENFNTSKVTDMDSMFYNSKATELDLSSFDTSNVTDMDWMFTDSKATELDLSNFNTSNVTSMTGMFVGTKATELDLSSFNTSNVTNMDYMFESSKAKTVYARTQADADNINASRPKPIGLQVIVKQ